jgi:tyrosyl-tRNA synthetase
MLTLRATVKIAELLAAGCHVKILLADIHAYRKKPLEMIIAAPT